MSRCKELGGQAAGLDDGFHTDQLRREDPWRYAVVEVLLELQQLAHEVEVRRDDGPLAFDKLVGVGHGHPAVLHQVGDHNGGRSRHARLAVNQEAHTCLLCFLDKLKRLLEVLPQVLLVAVGGGQALVVEQPSVIVVERQVGGHVENVADVGALQQVEVLSVVLVPQVEEGQDRGQLRVLDVRGGGQGVR